LHTSGAPPRRAAVTCPLLRCWRTNGRAGTHAHNASCPPAHGGDGGAGGAGRPAPNKEVKLDELSKYFHLPEKAVAKELGICLTSLKKLCRYLHPRP